MDDFEVRRARLIWLKEHRCKKSLGALARKLNKSPAQVSQWLSGPEVAGRRRISAATARYIEQQFDYPKYWLDGDVDGNESAVSPMAMRLARHFDRIGDEQRQNAAFVKIMEVIDVAAKPPAPDASALLRRSKSPPPASKKTPAG